MTIWACVVDNWDYSTVIEKFIFVLTQNWPLLIMQLLAIWFKFSQALEFSLILFHVWMIPKGFFLEMKNEKRGALLCSI